MRSQRSAVISESVLMNIHWWHSTTHSNRVQIKFSSWHQISVMHCAIRGTNTNFWVTPWVNALPLRTTVDNDSIWHRQEVVHLRLAKLFPMLVQMLLSQLYALSQQLVLCITILSWQVSCCQWSKGWEGPPDQVLCKATRAESLPGDCHSGPACGAVTELVRGIRVLPGRPFLWEITGDSCKRVKANWD